MASYWSLKTTITYAIEFHNSTVTGIGPIKKQPICLHFSSKYTHGFVEPFSFLHKRSATEEHWYYKSQTHIFNLI